ncbi:MAG: hypothetical protein AB1426_04520 [Bacillota bacterium]
MHAGKLWRGSTGAILIYERTGFWAHEPLAAALREGLIAGCRGPAAAAVTVRPSERLLLQLRSGGQRSGFRYDRRL